MSQARNLAVVLCLALCFAPPLQAQDRQATERKFRAWLESDVWSLAQERGVPRAVFEESLRGVSLNWSLPGINLPGANGQRSQKQAEFRSPQNYFRREQIQTLARIGRDLNAQHQRTLQQTAIQTGVPAHIVLAIWGRESAFGRVGTPHNAFEVLATRGFFGPNPGYFTGELVAAMTIAHEGLAPNRSLRSSWAGALGQPQFMPTSYLAYGADGNGDRKVDIWGSPQDTIASIARFLVDNGWVRGRDWGFEVRLPNAGSCTMEGPDRARSIREWERLGFARISGRPFPESERSEEAYLVMPAGGLGPAFLVTPNFSVLKRYNRSDLYALYIGNVGDRIAWNMGDFRGGWRKSDKLLRSDVQRIQSALELQGYDVGGADGIAGFKTRRSIGDWQKSAGQQPTCFPSRAILQGLSG